MGNEAFISTNKINFLKKFTIYIIGVNITAFGWEIPLFKNNPAFPIKMSRFLFISHRSCLVSICIMLCGCLFGIKSCVNTSYDLARAKEVKSYLSSG